LLVPGGVRFSSCCFGDLRLQVRDNGRGIDATALADQERQGHYGLVGMRERAELIGSELTVFSAPDAGTEVVLLMCVLRSIRTESYLAPDVRK
jgi:nitrate/nitrite-specific signal transduction histidine kinase